MFFVIGYAVVIGGLRGLLIEKYPDFLDSINWFSGMLFGYGLGYLDYSKFFNTSKQGE